MVRQFQTFLFIILENCWSQQLNKVPMILFSSIRFGARSLARAMLPTSQIYAMNFSAKKYSPSSVLSFKDIRDPNKLKAHIRQTITKKGSDGVQFAEAMTNLENFLYDAFQNDRLDEALDMYRFKVEQVKHIFGEDSKKYMNELRKLAYYYENSGFFAEALETLEIILSRVRIEQGRDTEWTIVETLYKQGVCLERLKRYKESKQKFYKGLELSSNIKEDSYHKKLINGALYTGLGIAEANTGQTDFAIEQLERALNIVRNENKNKISPVDEDIVARAFVELAKIKANIGKGTEAQALIIEGMDYLRNDQWRWTRTKLMKNIAKIYASMEKYDEANQIYQMMLGRLPIMSRAKILLRKIELNQAEAHPNYDECIKDCERLSLIYKEMKLAHESEHFKNN